MRRATSTLVALLVVAVVALTVVTRDPTPSNDGLILALTGVMAAVGLVVLRRQPRNIVAWLLIATAVIALIDAVTRLYLVLDYRQHGGRLPLGPLAVEYRGGLSILPFLVGLPAILLFPYGEVPSRRWRRALQVYVVLAAAFAVSQFAGQATEAVARHEAIDVRGGLPPSDNPGIVAGLAWFLVPFFLAFWLAGVGHQIRSWRRAAGERKAQLKWLMAGGAVCVVSSVALVLKGDGTSLGSRVVADLAVLGIAALPVAIGVGILRYRLYDIDRLISRTLSYALLTGLLVAVFAGLVLLTTRVLPFSSPVGVAASTLAAAALFNPLRRRIQRVVDRRFNRARYDAEELVTAFGTRLRDALELETVVDELLVTATRSLEPAHVSIWIRGATTPSP